MSIRLQICSPSDIDIGKINAISEDHLIDLRARFQAQIAISSKR